MCRNRKGEDLILNASGAPIRDAAGQIVGGVVMFLKPGAGESRIFFAFCLISAATTILYPDLHTTHRFTTLMLATWALTPNALAPARDVTLSDEFITTVTPDALG